MKSKIFTLLLLSSLAVFSQNKSIKSTILMGKLSNKSTKSLKFMIVDQYNTHLDSVRINQNGSFKIDQLIDKPIKMGVILNVLPVYFYVFPGDTINIHYDTKLAKPISVVSQSNKRTKQLFYDMTTIFNSSNYQDSLLNVINLTTINDSLKYDLSAKLYEEQLNKLIQNKQTLSNLFDLHVNELYFSFINFLNLHQLYKYEKLIKDKYNNKKDLPNSTYYSILSKKILIESPQYRLFIFNSVRRIPDEKDAALFIKFGDNKKSAPLIEYNKAKYVKNEYVKEWYITNSILFSFEHYSVQETEKIMMDFLPKCKNKEFSKIIKQFWNKSIRFKRGVNTPKIILNDKNGKHVSISDFKGKIVYINFWGVHCPPCIREIKESFPDLLSKYKDKDVVFVNICTDEVVEKWKLALNKYKLGGINLINLGNEALMAYGITFIPHHTIIDRNGKIYDYNASDPSELILSSNNSIDTILNTKK